MVPTRTGLMRRTGPMRRTWPTRRTGPIGVQAEEDEGELVGMGNTLRIQTLYYKVKAPG